MFISFLLRALFIAGLDKDGASLELAEMSCADTHTLSYTHQFACSPLADRFID